MDLKGNRLLRPRAGDSRSPMCRGVQSYLEPMVLCVDYSGHTDQHGVPLINGLHFHPDLEAVWRPLMTKSQPKRKGGGGLINLKKMMM